MILAQQRHGFQAEAFAFHMALHERHGGDEGDVEDHDPQECTPEDVARLSRREERSHEHDDPERAGGKEKELPVVVLGRVEEERGDIPAAGQQEDQANFLRRVDGG